MSFTFKPYPVALTANGAFRIPTAGAYFRIMSSTGPVDVTVEGVGTMPAMEAGQALKGVPFDGLLLKDASGAPNQVTVLIASSEFVDNRFNGDVDLTSATILDLRNLVAPLPGLSWSNLGAIAANTALQIFAPGSNPNGAIVYLAEACDRLAVNANQSFVAKSSAPASAADGEVLALSRVSSTSSTDLFLEISARGQLRIAAGLGLYFFSSAAGVATGMRSCRYTLL